MLIRLVLMPVLLRLPGRSAWALPRWLDRVPPDVRFAHETAGAATGRPATPAPLRRAARTGR